MSHVIAAKLDDSPASTESKANGQPSFGCAHAEQRENQSALPSDGILTARIECFDSFWEGPDDVERGYETFGRFYRHNYLKYLPPHQDASILVISCGPGYFVNMLKQCGYECVVGIDADDRKIQPGIARGLDCRQARAVPFLMSAERPFDVIVCEQELNHLTKAEMVAFLRLCRQKLCDGGTLVVHGLNGANPIVGAETLAQNFDHYNTFTAYSLEQVLEYSGFKGTRIFGLHLYVFYRNPMNYVAWGLTSLAHALFRAAFVLYGKKNNIWTKKIAAVAAKPSKHAQEHVSAPSQFVEKQTATCNET